MKTTSPHNTKHPVEIKNDHIHIIGPQRLQNDLLAFFLNLKTDLPCSHGTDSNLHRHIDSNSTPLPRFPLLLWDCLDAKMEAIFTKIKKIQIDQEYPPLFNALFNVKTEKEIEIKAIHMGIHGIFHINAPAQIFIKGFLVMQRGELWFSRQILSRHASDPPRFQNLSCNNLVLLTSREKEILFHITSGATTKKIASDLCISPHTVKTHTHNIFQKIPASNRLEATLWANENLY